MQSIDKDARIAGLLYLVLTLVGIFSLIYVPGRLFVHGNPGLTAANIATHETLFRLGIFGELAGIVVELALALALYRLFARIDKGNALLMVLLGGILPIPIYFANALNWVAALLLSKGGVYASALPAPGRDAAVGLFLNLHHYGFAASEIFAGLWLFPMGALVYRSRFVPRFLGVWLVLNGVAYLVLSFCGIVLPQYEDPLAKVTFPITLGEIVLMLWLLVAGAKEPRPATQAG
jgi:Domain of unknown function (DUF4386)